MCAHESVACIRSTVYVWLGLLSHGSGGLARTKSQSRNLTESVGAGETRHDTRPPLIVYSPDRPTGPATADPDGGRGGAPGPGAGGPDPSDRGPHQSPHAHRIR